MGKTDKETLEEMGYVSAAAGAAGVGAGAGAVGCARV